MILRTYFLLVVVCLTLSACADKVICPAYQSSFIHDKEELRKKFSYFENDSVPKVYTASKTKYLVAVPESYRKRYRKMQTVEMKPIYPVVIDSSADKKDKVNPMDSLLNLDSAAVAVLDSATRAKLDEARLAQGDSVYVITKDKEVRMLRYNFPDSLHYDSATGRYLKESPPYYYMDEVRYNAEQENYMWFFRKELILPDVRLSKIAEADKGKPKAVEKKSFFQKLMFWKKGKKANADSLKIKPSNLNDSDTLSTQDLEFEFDSTRKATPKTPVAPQKKGLKGLFKKKDKNSAEPPKSPAKKEEEDGF